MGQKLSLYGKRKKEQKLSHKNAKKKKKKALLDLCSYSLSVIILPVKKSNDVDVVL